MSETKTITEIVVFCPDCLKKMVNKSDPKTYYHLVPNKKCSVTAIHLNGKDKIVELVYFDGIKRTVIAV